MNLQPLASSGLAPASRPGLLAAIAILAAGAAIFALPILIIGPYPLGHDIFQHLNYCHQFNEQFWAGEWYPRWLEGLNRGLGSPTFFVYPPLPAYVYALLDPITRSLHLDTFAIEEYLTLFASGLTAFLWLQTMASRRMALAIALLYMFAPYHLKANTYQRGAFAECWAMVWMPLVLYLTAKAMQRRRWAVPLLAIAFSLLVLSHLISVFLFFLVPFAMALFLSAKGQRLRSASAVAFAMLLGTGLASFYLVPALYHAKNFPNSTYIPPISTYTIGAGNLSARFQGPSFNHTIALVGADAIAVCVLCGIIILIQGNSDRRRIASFWLSLSVLTGFLMLRWSSPVWLGMPPLLSAVQYPFRLNVLLCLASSALLALFSPNFEWKIDARSIWRVLTAVVVIVPWLYSYWAIWGMYRMEPNARVEVANHDYRDFGHDGFFRAWSPHGMDTASAIQASGGPRARFTSGSGTVSVISWAPRHIAMAASSTAGGRVMVNQFFYPSWQASLVGSGEQLAAGTELPEGFIQFSVPPGNQVIHLDLSVSSIEKAGCWVSTFSMLLVGMLTWRDIRSNHPPAIELGEKK